MEFPKDTCILAPPKPRKCTSPVECTWQVWLSWASWDRRSSGYLDSPEHRHKDPDEKEARRWKDNMKDVTPDAEMGAISGQSPGRGAQMASGSRNCREVRPFLEPAPWPAGLHSSDPKLQTVREPTSCCFEALHLGQFVTSTARDSHRDSEHASMWHSLPLRHLTPDQRHFSRFPSSQGFPHSDYSASICKTKKKW